MKKLKIEIKTFAGTVLFKYTCKDNTTKKTLVNAVKTGAYLRGAYLRGAYLRGAYLRGADLRGADLTGADLTGADLTGADLRGADLRGADLRGADLTGAYLNNIKIQDAAVFTGLYKYVVVPFISEDGESYVKMGCYIRTVKEWDKDFWNNPGEFKNDKSFDSELRLAAYKTAKKWIQLIKKEIK